VRWWHVPADRLGPWRPPDTGDQDASATEHKNVRSRSDRKAIIYGKARAKWPRRAPNFYAPISSWARSPVVHPFQLKPQRVRDRRRDLSDHHHQLPPQTSGGPSKHGPGGADMIRLLAYTLSLSSTTTGPQPCPGPVAPTPSREFAKRLASLVRRLSRPTQVDPTAVGDAFARCELPSSVSSGRLATVSRWPESRRQGRFVNPLSLLSRHQLALSTPFVRQLAPNQRRAGRAIPGLRNRCRTLRAILTPPRWVYRLEVSAFLRNSLFA